MKVVRGVARPMLAGMFVYGGLDAARHPESKAAKAQAVIDPIAEELSASKEPTDWVRFNGIAQVTAGLALACGKLPRLSALVLAVPWCRPRSRAIASGKRTILRNDPPRRFTF
ncbi:MAG: hypothetical protein QOI08_3372 [Actinomycetota bacterium]|jgi:uncharacterized membrane protein YphA (DoxX/SURF4 family)|nr:hypothetical protein [Actinomycetota bacterium]